MNLKNTQLTAGELRNEMEKIEALSAEESSKNGRRSAKERLLELFDEGTFVELQRFVKRSAASSADSGSRAFEGVVCGYGAIDGKLVYAFSQDYSRMKGAVDASHAKKILSLYELATKNGAPVVGFFDSDGAVVTEGVSALDGYASILHTVASASGVIPQIAIISGKCSGCAAAIAAMFDVLIISEETGKFSVNVPFLAGKEVSDTAMIASRGMIHHLVENDSAAIASARKLLAMLPSNNAEGTVYLGATLDNTQNTSLAYSGEIRSFVKDLSDNGDPFLLTDRFAPEMLSAFAYLGGTLVGILGNDASVNDGALTPAAAQKAARMISFCDCFNIPVLTLVDSVGTECSAQAESDSYPSMLAKLGAAYATSQTAKVTLILGKAFGPAYALMGSKEIGADIVFARSDVKVGCLPTDAEIEFLHRDELNASDAPAALRESLRNTLSSPEDAATVGDIDNLLTEDLIKPSLCSAFEMLSSKSEGIPSRRHLNYPL